MTTSFSPCSTFWSILAMEGVDMIFLDRSCPRTNTTRIVNGNLTWKQVKGLERACGRGQYVLDNHHHWNIWHATVSNTPWKRLTVTPCNLTEAHLALTRCVSCKVSRQDLAPYVNYMHMLVTSYDLIRLLLVTVPNNLDFIAWW